MPVNGPGPPIDWDSFWSESEGGPIFGSGELDPDLVGDPTNNLKGHELKLVIWLLFNLGNFYNPTAGVIIILGTPAREVDQWKNPHRQGENTHTVPRA